MLKLLTVFLVFISLSTAASDGRSTVSQINNRYHNIVKSCDSDSPAYYCSGIVIRVGGNYEGATGSGYPSWSIGPAFQKLGSGSFSFIRADLPAGARSIYNGYESDYNGLILFDRESADKMGKPFYVRCIWPRDGYIEFNRRERKGCGELGHDDSFDIGIDGDYSICKLHAINSALDWINKQVELTGTAVPILSSDHPHCSFNAKSAFEFMQSITTQIAIQTLDPNVDEDISLHIFNEVVIAAAIEGTSGDGWSTDFPQKNAIQAFYYRDNSEKGRHFAQEDQKLYLNMTGFYVPVLHLDTKRKVNPFIFFCEDQAISIDCQPLSINE